MENVDRTDRDGKNVPMIQRLAVPVFSKEASTSRFVVGMFLVVLALLAFFAFTAHADFEFAIEQSLSVENAGIVYQGYEGPPDGFVPIVVNGDDIAVPSHSWTVNFLKPFSNVVPPERGVYVLFRNTPDSTPEDGPETDFLAPGENFEMIHGAVPVGAGPASVSFSTMPALGTSAASGGEYTLFVYELPETKLVYDFDTDTVNQLPYTEQDFIQWFQWTYGVDYDVYIGGTPDTFGPLALKEFNFNYIATTGTPVAECCSSVAFLPGIKGSILKTSSETLWPADSSGTDISQLALTEEGESVNAVFVDGILPSFKIHIPILGNVGPEIYSGLITFMNNLVANTTDDIDIREWKPLPYDWRYSPDYVVSHDVETPGGPVNLVEEIERLAANSATGQVTIIAHSMGGLVGKALIKALEDKGKANLIDSFVMIGSPELGTPQAVASLLHGDNEGIPGKTLVPNFIATRGVVRATVRNFPGAYALLPSAHYFDEVTDPVLVFDDVLFTQAWRDLWSSAINTHSPFVEFLTGTGVSRVRPTPSAIHLPEVLRADLVTGAGDFHATYDTYSIPSNIRVVEVAGWGEETTKAVEYKTWHFTQSYNTVPTIEGDGVVVYPSAVSFQSEKNYFNLFSYKTETGIAEEHGTLMNSIPVQDLLSRVIEGNSISGINFISNSKPEPDVVGDRLRVSTHSPVILGAHDSLGNFTGIYPNQDLSAAFLYVQEGIPGSTFVTSGDSQYLYLPKEGSYTLTYQGTGIGPTTVEVSTFINDTVVPVTTYTDISTTAETDATFIINSAAPQDAHIQLDQNSDGQIDMYIAPDGGTLSLAELLTNLTTTVQSLTIKDKLKTQLLNKIAIIQKKIDKQKQKQSTVLAKLQAQIAKQAGKGKIDSATAASISALLDNLIAQNATIPLDHVLIQQLKDQINGATITQFLKTLLLNKVAKLENLSSLHRSLGNLTQTVIKKGSKGQIPDIDVQNILNLLNQIQNAI